VEGKSFNMTLKVSVLSINKLMFWFILGNVDVSVEKSSSELQVGDRIIEVNGEPVHNESLAEVTAPSLILLNLVLCVLLNLKCF